MPVRKARSGGLTITVSCCLRVSLGLLLDGLMSEDSGKDRNGCGTVPIGVGSKPASCRVDEDGVLHNHHSLIFMLRPLRV